LAYATDRESIIRYLLHGQARPADGVLPPNSWAYEPNVNRYAYDPARAEQLLQAAGFARRPEDGGMRLHVVLKTSTDEIARTLGTALQEQWRRVGVDLEVRSQELATLFADLNRGNFDLAYLIWVGANEDPDFFDYVFNSSRVPPNGANRGRYRNTSVDALLNQARIEPDQAKRRALFSEVQRIVAADLPYINLWYADQISVHRRRVQNVALAPSGDYDFIGKVTLSPQP
jgi:peptide/nickel transport system substrate-binding protein